jgi:hypothetical protein
MMYTALPPGVYDALPSDFVSASATLPLRASLSDADAVAPEASVAVTVFTSGSVASDEANATGTVNVSSAAPPAGSDALLAAKDVAPAPPVTVPHDALPVAAHVTAPASRAPAGKASVTATLAASDVPVLATVAV